MRVDAAPSRQGVEGMSIVVVTDGSRGADGALRLGVELSRREEVPVRLVSVVDPIFVPGATTRDVDEATRRAWIDEAVAAREAEVLSRVEAIDLAGGGTELALHVEVGDPTGAGARLSEAEESDLLVVGLGHHGGLDRMLGSETALRIMARATIPVLAVHPRASSLPTLALVATDFGEASRTAALRALSLLAPGATLHLAHVLRMARFRLGGSRRAAHRDERAADALIRLEGLCAELRSRAPVNVRGHLLAGAPLRELRSLAGSLAPDLVVAGTRSGARAGRRARLGRVARELVRDARYCALVVPSAVCGRDADVFVADARARASSRS
jgi:nucleotide-binding universal stress UspA family protein